MYLAPEFSGRDEAASGLTLGIRTRTDFDYAAQLLGMDPINEAGWHPQAQCALPKVDVYVSLDFLRQAGRT